MTDWTVRRCEWPYTTPSGHTYEVPRTYEDLCRRSGDFVQGWIEHWDEPEMPPHPTWDILGLAQQENERLRNALERVLRGVTSIENSTYEQFLAVGMSESDARAAVSASQAAAKHMRKAFEDEL